MAQIFTIAERRLSGTGVIIPTAAQLNYRRYTLFADIIRKPRSPYINTKSDPNETYYGVISLIKSGYVVRTYPIQFDAQVWTFDADITGQVINTIKCEYIGVLISFINLGTALGAQLTSVVNAIADFKNLPLEWDSIRVKCFGDCAIQFALKAIEYDTCNEADKVPSNPPPPPTKPAIVSPGIATNISPAYPGDTITSPAPIDLTYVPPPLGNVCQAVTLRWDMQVSTQGAPPTTVGGAIALYGPISQAFSLKPGQSNVLQTSHRGYAASQGCQVAAVRDIISLGATSVILSWSNIRIT